MEIVPVKNKVSISLWRNIMIKTITSANLPVDETYEIQKNHLVLGNGKKRICIVTGTHGDELEGQYVCFELQKIIEKQHDLFDGIIDIYPAINPLGLESMTRKVPFFDLDMNRIFPGDKEGSLVEYVAYQIIQDLKGADLVVDIHASNVYLKEIPQIRINETQSAGLIELAKQMNVDFIWEHSASTVLESTLAYSLNDIKTPTLVVEMGVGLRITKNYGNQLIAGLLNVMKYLGMYHGETVCKEPMISTDKNVFFLNAKEAGLFLPTIAHDYHVQKGQKIGEIVNPLTGEVEEEVCSPCTGLVFTLREYPLVNKGSLLGRILENQK